MKREGNEAWKRILWTDESAVILTPTHQKIVWVDQGCQIEDIYKFKYPKTMWVWAGISWEGATKLIFLKWEKGGGFKAQNYQEQVLRKIKDFMSKTVGEGGMLMEDGSKCHTAKTNVEFRQLHGIKTYPPK